jgi:hypothetical protein
LIFPNTYSFLLFSDRVLFDDVFWFGGNPSFEIFDVVRVVELCHFLGGGLFGVVHFELGCEVIVIDETVYHFDAFCLHGMFFAELVFGDIFVVEVADLAHNYKLNYT